MNCGFGRGVRGTLLATVMSCFDSLTSWWPERGKAENAKTHGDWHVKGSGDLCVSVRVRPPSSPPWLSAVPRDDIVELSLPQDVRGTFHLFSLCPFSMFINGTQRRKPSRPLSPPLSMPNKAWLALEPGHGAARPRGRQGQRRLKRERKGAKEYREHAGQRTRV